MQTLTKDASKHPYTGVLKILYWAFFCLFVAHSGLIIFKFTSSKFIKGSDVLQEGLLLHNLSISEQYVIGDMLFPSNGKPVLPNSATRKSLFYLFSCAYKFNIINGNMHFNHISYIGISIGIVQKFLYKKIIARMSVYPTFPTEQNETNENFNCFEYIVYGYVDSTIIDICITGILLVILILFGYTIFSHLCEMPFNSTKYLAILIAQIGCMSTLILIPFVVYLINIVYGLPVNSVVVMHNVNIIQIVLIVISTNLCSLIEISNEYGPVGAPVAMRKSTLRKRKMKVYIALIGLVSLFLLLFVLVHRFDWTVKEFVDDVSVNSTTKSVNWGQVYILPVFTLIFGGYYSIVYIMTMSYA
jgi:hypothetical protein